MKKLMLCSILSILFFNVYSQDTICTLFKDREVFEFDYYKSEILNVVEQEEKFYEIEVKHGDILCLDLWDGRKRFRKVIIEYFNGEVLKEFLDSNDKTYYSPRGAVKILVGRPKIFKI